MNLSLKDIINQDLKQAMRERQGEKLSTLRLLLAAIKDKEIFLRKGEDVILSDSQIIEVVMSEIKKRKDSVSAYEAGGRQDLAEKEKREILILEKYLPPAISDEELESIVKEAIGEIGEADIKNFGKIMGKVMLKAKGRADGNRISEAVRQVLAE